MAYGPPNSLFSRFFHPSSEPHSKNRIDAPEGGCCTLTKFVRASPLVSSILPNKTTSTFAPASASNLAVAAPSPPLLPRPQITKIDLLATLPRECSTTARAVAVAACAVKDNDGIPQRS